MGLLSLPSTVILSLILSSQGVKAKSCHKDDPCCFRTLPVVAINEDVKLAVSSVLWASDCLSALPFDLKAQKTLKRNTEAVQAALDTFYAYKYLTLDSHVSDATPNAYEVFHVSTDIDAQLKAIANTHYTNGAQFHFALARATRLLRDAHTNYRGPFGKTMLGLWTVKLESALTKDDVQVFYFSGVTQLGAFDMEGAYKAAYGQTLSLDTHVRKSIKKVNGEDALTYFTDQAWSTCVYKDQGACVNNYLGNPVVDIDPGLPSSLPISIEFDDGSTLELYPHIMVYPGPPTGDLDTFAASLHRVVPSGEISIKDIEKLLHHRHHKNQKSPSTPPVPNMANLPACPSWPPLPTSPASLYPPTGHPMLTWDNEISTPPQPTNPPTRCNLGKSWTMAVTGNNDPNNENSENPPRNDDPPSAFCTEDGDMCYSTEILPTGTLFKLGSFMSLPDDAFEFINMMTRAADTYGKGDRLVIDVSGNGGGYVVTAEMLQRWLVPDFQRGNESCSTTDFREAKFWDKWEDAYFHDNSTLPEGKFTRMDRQALAVLWRSCMEQYYSKTYCKWLSVEHANRQELLTRVRTEYTPHSQEEIGGFEAYRDQSVMRMRGGKKSWYSKLHQDGCEGHTDQLPTGKDGVTPFYFPDIRILTDGQCGSSCALFTTKMWQYEKARFFSYGGMANLGMNFAAFTGGNVERDEEFWQKTVFGALAGAVATGNYTVVSHLHSLVLGSPGSYGFTWHEAYYIGDRGMGPNPLPREWYRIPADFHVNFWPGSNPQAMMVLYKVVGELEIAIDQNNKVRPNPKFITPLESRRPGIYSTTDRKDQPIIEAELGFEPESPIGFGGDVGDLDWMEVTPADYADTERDNDGEHGEKCGMCQHMLLLGLFLMMYLYNPMAEPIMDTEEPIVPVVLKV